MKIVSKVLTSSV